MKSVMEHKFSRVPGVKIPRSRFNRSHGIKTTFDASNLIVLYVDEALPGDTFRFSMNGFARLATPIYPIMDNLFLETFFFEIPMRQLWSNWRKFCGEQTDPGDSIAFTVPVINDINNVANESIYDYMGIPTKIAANMSISALPLRAYYHVFNEWFRDQNLQDSLDWDTDDGPDAEADFEIQKVCKKHDYFTSCLPFLQKGDAVELALGTNAPIYGLDMDFDGVEDTDNIVNIRSGIGSGTRRALAAGSYVYGYNAPQGSSQEIMTDLTLATSSTVNELRQAIQVQRILERDARSGSRYAEIVKSHFGVEFNDLAYRPIYLGGGKTPIQIKPIARTDSSPGVLGAMGVGGFQNHGFVKSFNEHSIILGLACVRADLTYQEGLDRMWSRSTRYDFYWPSLAHLGEQSVLNQEVYIDAAMIGAGTEDDVFGYQERYAEYRYKPSKITGKFRSNDAASLDAWHLGIEFGALPTLDDTFIVDATPLDRCIATPSEPHFIFDGYVSLDCVRPMPVYSVPGHMDHF